MKRHSLIAAILCLMAGIVPGLAQTGMLKLEDMWGNRQFFAKGLPEVRSLNNGTQYTALEEDSVGQYIVKYDYKTAKATDTLFNSRVTLSNGKKSPYPITH